MQIFFSFQTFGGINEWVKYSTRHLKIPNVRRKKNIVAEGRETEIFLGPLMHVKRQKYLCCICKQIRICLAGILGTSVNFL